MLHKAEFNFLPWLLTNVITIVTRISKGYGGDRQSANSEAFDGKCGKNYNRIRVTEEMDSIFVWRSVVLETRDILNPTIEETVSIVEAVCKTTS